MVSNEYVEIQNKHLSVKSLPLDCSDSLKQTKFTPQPIEPNKDVEVYLGNGYKSFFKHSKEKDCIIDKCILMEKECKEQKEFIDLSIGGGPSY